MGCGTSKDVVAKGPENVAAKATVKPVHPEVRERNTA
jgi:hypothetical protein